MSLVKKLLDLPVNSKLRKQGEAFLSGKPLPNENFSIKKGDEVKLKDGREGTIMSYASNKHIGFYSDGMEFITKDDIEEVLS